MTVIINSRNDITLEAFQSVAWEARGVELSGQVLAKLQAARRDFLELIEDPNITVYGVNTGYGQRAKERLDQSGRDQQARQPTHYRAASWGDPVPDRVARGIIFARLANFVDGHAAISPHVAEAVAAMLGFPEPWRFDPMTLWAALVARNQPKTVQEGAPDA